MGRLIAIADIHGYSEALTSLLRLIRPTADDIVVTLGDYCDRGPDTKGVLECLIELRARCQLVPLLGNHDQMLLEIATGLDELLEEWLDFGGRETLRSYGVNHPKLLPEKHLEFLAQCPLYFETDGYFFVHANYLPEVPLQLQPVEVLCWESLKTRVPPPHVSGKIAVVGHTAQPTREVLDLGHLICLDTCCYGGGWLTAMEVPSRRLWQVDQQGRLRGG
ncbi:MAG: serine/threonine protein phosphatase [Thermoguttaceae bacterium]|nr:serine/threonine protein phosphatase [Thermoguttaceae bacterium]MDW8080030.1 metallophosphoesterase family protein [Thermoguttaceae bacterium]